MLNIVWTYGSEFSLSINSIECGVLICNIPDEGIEDFIFGNQIAKRVNECKYVWVFLREGYRESQIRYNF